MNKLHSVMKSITVLNCLLTLTVAAAAYYVVVPFLNLNIQVGLPAAGTTGSEKAEQPAAVPNPAFSEFAMVSEQNLFHPERRIPPEKQAADDKPPPPPKPDLVLYGTLISDDLSIAYVEDRKVPYTTPGRGNRQTQVKKGGSVSGFTLREIEPDRIVLTRGEETLVVMLADKEKKRSEAPAGAAAVASSGLPLRPPAPLPPRAATGSPAPAAGTTTAASPAPTTGASVAAPPRNEPAAPLTRRPYSIQDLLKLKTSPFTPQPPAGN